MARRAGGDRVQVVIATTWVVGFSPRGVWRLAGLSRLLESGSDRFRHIRRPVRRVFRLWLQERHALSKAVVVFLEAVRIAFSLAGLK